MVCAGVGPSGGQGKIAAAETALGVRFPPSYVEFLLEFGGGYFGLASIFSVEPGSPRNIVSRNSRCSPAEFIAISDCGTGDLFGLRVTDRQCGEEVYLLDHETAVRQLTVSFANVFELLAALALQPA